MIEHLQLLMDTPVALAFAALGALIILLIAIGRVISFRGETSAGWCFSDHLSCRYEKVSDE
jgi:hypothetical protein